MSTGPELTFPETVAEACATLDDDALALAGGTALALLLKNGFVAPSRLVVLSRIPGLRGVRAEVDGSLRIGASTTLYDLARDPLLRLHCPSLSLAASRAANPRVRAVATLGGHLAHADPRQDLPPVLLALDARVEVTGPAGTRAVPLDDFLVGFMETLLAPDDLVVALTIPPRAGHRDVYLRYSPTSFEDYPTVGAAADLALEPDGTVRAARVALGGVGSRAFVVAGAESLLAGSTLSDGALAALADAARAQSAPVDDQRGAAGYKAAMAGLFATRAVRAAAQAPPAP